MVQSAEWNVEEQMVMSPNGRPVTTEELLERKEVFYTEAMQGNLMLQLFFSAGQALI